MTDDRDDEISGREAGVRRSRFHLAQRFVSDDQPGMTGRRGAVQSRDELTIGSAHAEQQRTDQYSAAIRTRHAETLDVQGIRRARLHGECTHRVL